MVKLIGSEKQVKWAEEIRKDMVECLEKWIQASDMTYKDKEMSDVARKNLGIATNYLKEKLEDAKSQKNATWFIDRRSYVYSNLTVSGIKYGTGKDYKDINLEGIFENLENDNPLMYQFIYYGIFKEARENYINLF